MTHVLTARERKLMDYLQLDHRTFHIPGQLPTGSGKVTFDRLTGLGLLEAGPGRHGETGWRLTNDGWQCMYGRTIDEMATGGPFYPLRVWSWPPTLDRART